MSATHKLVPVEPTDEMKIVGADVLRATILSSREAAASWLYQKMLAAAPAPPTDLDPTERERVCKVLEPLIAGYKPVVDMLTGGYKPSSISINELRAATALLDELRRKG